MQNNSAIDPKAEFISQWGGMMAVGTSGLFVGDPAERGKCPPGWTFIEKSVATPESVTKAIASIKAGG